ncbi:hypothetical protein [Phocaeicola sp.]
MKISFETGNLPWTTYTPFIRFSFPEINKLKIFTEAQFNICNRDVDGGQSSYEEIGLSFGLSYPISKHLNFIGHYLFVGYSGDNNKEGAWLGKGKFAADANILRAQLGLQYIF